MAYRDRAAKIIRRYGQVVTICTGEESRDTCALIQPVRSRNDQGLEFTPAGAVDESRYLYIGEGDKAFEKGNVTIIRAGDISYHVEWSETFRVKEETVYVRAILRVCT